MFYDNILVENNETIHILFLKNKDEDNDFYDFNYDCEINYQNIDGLIKYTPLRNIKIIKELNFKMIEHCLVQIDENEKIFDGDFDNDEYYIFNGKDYFYTSNHIFYLRKIISKRKKDESNDFYLHYLDE